MDRTVRADWGWCWPRRGISGGLSRLGRGGAFYVMSRELDPAGRKQLSDAMPITRWNAAGVPMQRGRRRTLDAELPRQFHRPPEGLDHFMMGLRHVLHAGQNRPTRHMPSSHIGLCHEMPGAGTHLGMPKTPKAEIEDPGVTERQRQTGLRVRAIRKLSGLKQGPLAALCGADQSQWSRWERGERPVEVEAMLRFARRAKTSLDLIYYGRPIGTHHALLKLLRMQVPELLLPDPTDTDQDTDTALALYRDAIHQEKAE